MNPSNDSPTSPTASDADCGCAGSADSSTGSTAASSGAFAKAGTKIKEAARGIAEPIKSTASQAAARVKETASEYRDRAAEAASERKTQVADRLGRYGSAFHQSAESFEPEDQNIAHFAHAAADRIESVANYVRNRDFGALKADAEDIARRNPAVFFGGMFVAGLVIGNLLKAKPPVQIEDRSPEGPFTYHPAEDVPAPETMT